METNQQQQFTFLIKDHKGPVLEQIIEQIISSELHNFIDFLDMPNIKDLNNPIGQNKHYNTLELFALHNYKTYKEKIGYYISLNKEQLNKLKQLSICELANNNKTMSYTFIMKEIDIALEFELEQLLFNIISSGLLQGQVDSMQKTVIVISVTGRNNPLNEEKIMEILTSWIDNLDQVDQYIDKQIVLLKDENNNY